MRVVSDKDFCRQKDLRKWHNKIPHNYIAVFSPKTLGDVIDRGQDLIPDRRHRPAYLRNVAQYSARRVTPLLMISSLVA
jgi:hypothetical protein